MSLPKAPSIASKYEQHRSKTAQNSTLNPLHPVIRVKKCAREGNIYYAGCHPGSQGSDAAAAGLDRRPVHEPSRKLLTVLQQEVGVPIVV